jgi:hypothetical protein
MRILLIYIHYPLSSGRYCSEALIRMGHDVRHIGPCTGRDIWGIQVDEQYVWLPTEIEDGWIPELVILMDSAIQLEGKLRHLWRCPLVVYGVDNHVRDYHQFDGIADHFFLGHGHGLRIGEPNVTWLPCGYDPATFTPGPAWSERPTDWAMIGVNYGQRNELIGPLLSVKQGIRAAYGTGLLYDEYAQVYQDSKLSIVRSAAGDVAQRVWETAAMGCLVVMDECPDCAVLGLVDGENCLIYHSIQECVDKVRWTLTHPHLAEAMAQNGQEWAQSGTWDNRLQVIIDWADSFGKPADKPRKKKTE